jgi:predicted RNase H-like nuclease (RuvC/YqgF family)
MKKFITGGLVLFVLMGCGGKVKKDVSMDQRVSQLTEQVQMLQQTIEILAKETKNLQGELTTLKTQGAQGHADSALLKELETRVSDLEGSGYLK